MSMPPRTETSASGEYGGRRSYPGADVGPGVMEDSAAFTSVWLRPPRRRSVEGATSLVHHATEELDVVPGRSNPAGIPQEGGGMVRDDEGNSLVAVHLSPQLP